LTAVEAAFSQLSYGNAQHVHLRRIVQPALADEQDLTALERLAAVSGIVSQDFPLTD
jgi:hypothetical protein